MLVSEFNYSTDSKVVGSHIAYGKMPNGSIFIAFPVEAMKVLIYSPAKEGTPEQKQFLNINKEVTALFACKLNPNLNYDMLIVGTKCSLQCYGTYIPRYQRK